jgi:hypothetical protein
MVVSPSCSPAVRRHPFPVYRFVFVSECFFPVPRRVSEGNKQQFRFGFIHGKGNHGRLTVEKRIGTERSVRYSRIDTDAIRTPMYQCGIATPHREARHHTTMLGSNNQ